MKKLLSTRLAERTESIEYRAIVKQLMILAQNRKNEYRLLRIRDYARNRLQNEGINITQITEFGTDKYLLTWNK